jgi:hypothetical protein
VNSLQSGFFPRLIQVSGVFIIGANYEISKKTTQNFILTESKQE